MRQALADSPVPVFLVNPSEPWPPGRGREPPTLDLPRFAEASGGYATRVRTLAEMSSAIRQIATVARTPYLLAFQGPPASSPLPLKLRVDVTGIRPRPRVHYRAAYRARQ